MSFIIKKSDKSSLLTEISYLFELKFAFNIMILSLYLYIYDV